MKRRNSVPSIRHPTMETRVNIPPIEQVNPPKKTVVCATIIKFVTLMSAVLVPVMIGTFTLVTTMQESKNTQLQREADILKTDRQQLHETLQTAQLRIENVYNQFMQDMLPIVMKENSNLTSAELLFARAKTLTTLAQIDEQRKWYLIKYLYDNLLLLSTGTKKYINLEGADLSNVKFGSHGTLAKMKKQVNLAGIRLNDVILHNSTFENVFLYNASFARSDLTQTNFIHTSIDWANFNGAVLEESRFLDVDFSATLFHDVNLTNSLFIKTSFAALEFIDCDFRYSIFRESSFTTTRFDKVDCRQCQFVNISWTNSELVRVDLNGSNLSADTISGSSMLIEHSILPNGTFKSSLIGTNLIKNNGAEEGHCHSNESAQAPTKIPKGWLYGIGTIQLLYSSINMDHINDNTRSQCLFFGGSRPPLYDDQNNFLLQHIEIDDLSLLTESESSRDVKYFLSAFLGGVANKRDSATVTISFRDKYGNLLGQNIAIGPVNNIDRQNKTTMLFRSNTGTLPQGTRLIHVGLEFDKEENQNGPLYGVADDLQFLITVQ